MTVFQDLVATICVQCVAFGVACRFAWMHGRPVPAQVLRALKWAPYLFIAIFSVNAIGVFAESDGYVSRHPWQHLHDICGSVLWFTAAVLALAFSRVGPWLMLEGAKRNPRQFSTVSAAELHARRRASKAFDRAALPFYVIGLGAFLICCHFAMKAADGELLIFGFLGMAAWLFVVGIVSDRLARNRVKNNEQQR